MRARMQSKAVTMVAAVAVVAAVDVVDAFLCLLHHLHLLLVSALSSCARFMRPSSVPLSKVLLLYLMLRLSLKTSALIRSNVCAIRLKSISCVFRRSQTSQTLDPQKSTGNPVCGRVEPLWPP